MSSDSLTLTPLRVLFLEDNPLDAQLMSRALRRAGFDLEHLRVQTEADYLAELGHDYDVILADYTLPGFSAPLALEHLNARNLDIPFIVVTGSVSEEAAVECMRQGAADYLLKDRLERLGKAVNRALEAKALREEKRRADREREELLLREQWARQEMEKQASELKRLNLELERRLAHLTALREVETAISGSVNLPRTLALLLEKVLDQLHIDAATVLLLHTSSQILHLGASRGFRIPIPSQAQLRLGEGQAGRAALTGEQVFLTGDPFEHAFRAVPQFLEEGFRSYLAIPLIARGQTQGVMELFHRTTLTPDEDWFDLLAMLGNQAAIAIDNATLFDSLNQSHLELLQAYDTTIEGWAHALDLRDKETEGHSRRVTELTVALARQLNVPEEDIVHLRRGALLHDIGKMAVPDGILLKPGKLTDEEWSQMKKHPRYAYDLLSPIKFLRPALDIPYCHHEAWDGSGYPKGLKGEQIPLAARIFAIVDVYDALTSNRPYRTAWSPEQALAYIQERSGRQFDPVVVKAFSALIT